MATERRPRSRSSVAARSARGKPKSAEPVAAQPLHASKASVKLHKFLADRGLGSRRELERWIAAGRILVDDKVAPLGTRVFGSERIVVDGKLLSSGATKARPPIPRVLILNKAAGLICTHKDPERRRTVFADLPHLKVGRWIGVGRLDAATTGLLLVTNDGELAHRMMHPSTGLDREYAVRTDSELADEALEALRAGVTSEGQRLRFSDIRYFNGSEHNHWYHAVLLEGRNHEVRRLFASQGVEVLRLKRVRYGPVALPSWLRRGQRFELNNADLKQLYKIMGLRLSLPNKRPQRRGGDRHHADRSVLLPYPELKSQG